MTRKAKQETYRCTKPFEEVLELDIKLTDSDPLVWRLIEVPDCYSFWDLHCAITDSMGWLDEDDLHVFRVWDEPIEDDPFRRPPGIPNMVGLPTQFCPFMPNSWEYNVLAHYMPCPYGEYTLNWPYGESFDDVSEGHMLDPDEPITRADEWHHTILLSDVSDRQDNVAYPRCIDGANACPPDGCGGLAGYKRFLDAITDPEAPDHAKQLKSVGGRFDPGWFDISLVRFEDPDLRGRLMLEGKPLPKTMRQVQYHRLRRA